MLCVWVVNLLIRYVLMGIPISSRMFLVFPVYWLIALVPVVFMMDDKEKLSDYGFRFTGLVGQIAVGIGLGAVMSLLFTLLPHLFGFGAYVSSSYTYSYLWQFLYQFVYLILAVGFVEELVFRGFLYEKCRRIFGTELAAVAVSSVMFGLFHIFVGNIVQVLVTGCIGALFCLCRMKIRGCTIISLIFMHGVYDFLIIVWASLLAVTE